MRPQALPTVAVAVWCGAAVVMALKLGSIPVLIASVMVVGAIGVMRARVDPLVAALLLGCVLSACVASIRLSALDAATVLPEPGTWATAELVIDADPRIVDGSVTGSRRGPPRAVVAVTVTRLSWRDGDVQAHLPAALWEPADAPPLLPGTHAVVRARTLVGDVSRGTALALSVTTAPVTTADAPVWQRWAGALRAGLRRAVTGLPADGAGLLPGLVLGDTSALPDDLEADMRSVGLTHLVAVSGTNVSVVLAAALSLASLIRVRGRGRAVLALVALVGFVILVRPSPSVVRAAAMGGVAIIALAMGGRRSGRTALAAAVIVLVLADPWLAVSAGFALSAVATWGLLSLAPPIRDWLSGFSRLPRPLVEGLAVTLAAQVATLPVLVLIGASVGLGSIPANLLAEVAVAPATLLGVGATMASAVSAPLAAVIAVPAVACAEWIARVAHTAAAYAPLPLPWPHGPGGAALACVLLLAGWFIRRRHRPIVRGVSRLPPSVIAPSVAIVVVLGLTIPNAARSAWPPSGWVAVACDVGQGDAIVVRDGEDSAVVVDVGPRPEDVDRCLSDLGIAQISAVVLTHFHADHVEGLPGLLHGRSVQQVIVSPLRDPVDEADRVDRWCSSADVPVRVAAAGDEWVIGSTHWKLLWPARIIRGEGSDANNASLTAVVESGGASLLLGGDLEPASQAAMMARVGSIRVDVVKVPHHGSRRQEPTFGAWTGARAAIVSVGADNDYGHPAPATLRSFEDRGVPVWRTDRDGDVAVVVQAGEVAVVARERGQRPQ